MGVCLDHPVSGGRYLGCAYFRPTPGTCGEGRAAYWIRDIADRSHLLRKFGTDFGDWLARFLPYDYVLTRYSNDWPDPLDV